MLLGASPLEEEGCIEEGLTLWRGVGCQRPPCVLGGSQLQCRLSQASCLTYRLPEPRIGHCIPIFQPKKLRLGNSHDQCPEFLPSSSALSQRPCQQLTHPPAPSLHRLWTWGSGVPAVPSGATPFPCMQHGLWGAVSGQSRASHPSPRTSHLPEAWHPFPAREQLGQARRGSWSPQHLCVAGQWVVGVCGGPRVGAPARACSRWPCTCRLAG